jgi:predicted DCC family thiol-disulfide oxidoreductase YuxK
MPAIPILYDPDCGFCKLSLAVLLRWDAQHRLRPVPLGSDEANALLRDMPEEQRMASWHLVEQGGAVHSAGAAFPALFAQLPGARPLARLTSRYPRASERAYRWVAGHRSILGRPFPAATRQWADAQLSSRR